VAKATIVSMPRLPALANLGDATQYDVVLPKVAKAGIVIMPPIPTLATLGDSTQILSFLFALCRLRYPDQQACTIAYSFVDSFGWSAEAKGR
jgi:hypothetical protein